MKSAITVSYSGEVVKRVISIVHSHDSNPSEALYKLNQSGDFTNRRVLMTRNNGTLAVLYRGKDMRVEEPLTKYLLNLQSEQGSITRELPQIISVGA